MGTNPERAEPLPVPSCWGAARPRATTTGETGEGVGEGVAETCSTLPHPPDDVFAVLVTPETYPFWLVGCQAIRAVDEAWPAVGSAFHHRVGLVGPLTVADSTKVLTVEASHLLALEVRARPLGRGRVTFRLDPADDGATTVVMAEVPIGGLGPLQPLLDPVTDRRNQRSLTLLGEYLDADVALHDGSGGPVR